MMIETCDAAVAHATVVTVLLRPPHKAPDAIRSPVSAPPDGPLELLGIVVRVEVKLRVLPMPLTLLDEPIRDCLRHRSDRALVALHDAGLSEEQVQEATEGDESPGADGEEQPEREPRRVHVARADDLIDAAREHEDQGADEEYAAAGLSPISKITAKEVRQLRDLDNIASAFTSFGQ